VVIRGDLEHALSPSLRHFKAAGYLLCTYYSLTVLIAMEEEVQPALVDGPVFSLPESFVFHEKMFDDSMEDFEHWLNSALTEEPHRIPSSHSSGGMTAPAVTARYPGLPTFNAIGSSSFGSGAGSTHTRSPPAAGVKPESPEVQGGASGRAPTQPTRHPLLSWALSQPPAQTPLALPASPAFAQSQSGTPVHWPALGAMPGVSQMFHQPSAVPYTFLAANVSAHGHPLMQSVAPGAVAKPKSASFRYEHRTRYNVDVLLHHSVCCHSWFSCPSAERAFCTRCAA